MAIVEYKTINKKRGASRPVTVEERSIMATLYASGKSSNDIAVILDRSGRNIRKHLSLMGLSRNIEEGVDNAIKHGKIRKHFFNEHFFDELTPESAWALGLIIGDGHIHYIEGEQNKIELVGSEDVVEKFRKLLEHPGKIVRCKDRDGKYLNCWKFQGYSKHIVDLMYERYGMRGNKSHTVKFPEVSQGLLPHLLRGLMDSDGGWKVRGGCLTADYTSCSPYLISGMIKTLNDLNIHPKLVKTELYREKDNNVFIGYKLLFNAKQARSLADLIYTESNDKIRCIRKHGAAVLGIYTRMRAYKKRGNNFNVGKDKTVIVTLDVAELINKIKELQC